MPKAINWTSEMDAALGTMFDPAAAKQLGISHTTVTNRRKALGIDSFTNVRSWCPEEDVLLGTMSDRLVGEQLGIPAHIVWKRRKTLGIPGSHKHVWSPEQDALLGMMPDSKLAKLVGHTEGTISRRRRELGIPSLHSQEMDLMGKSFGKWTVLKQGERRGRKARWWCRCDCGTEALIYSYSLRAELSSRCLMCVYAAKSGENNSNWKGGTTRSEGYIRVHTPEHPNKDKYEYVPEHRLVMEQHLGRYLTSGEGVHHKNGIRNDNRIENLELTTRNHFPGMRVTDLVEYAVWVLTKYAPERLK